MNSETTKFYGIGRRKESVAQALLTVGTGSVLINNKDAKEYLQNNESRFLRINQPLETLNLANTFDIRIKTKGGGMAGQTDAICLAISRALVECDPSNSTSLTSPVRPPPCMAAPMATTSSGFTDWFGFLPVNVSTKF